MFHLSLHFQGTVHLENMIFTIVFIVLINICENYYIFISIINKVWAIFGSLYTYHLKFSTFGKEVLFKINCILLDGCFDLKMTLDWFLKEKNTFFHNFWESTNTKYSHLEYRITYHIKTKFIIFFIVFGYYSFSHIQSQVLQFQITFMQTGTHLSLSHLVICQGSF